MMKPEIIFETNHYIVAYKPSGFLSQADGSEAPDMLTFLKDYIKDKYNKPGDVYLGLVHRLDRPVSGVMVFARTSKCASRLSEQIRTGKFDKRYCAVVEGCFEEKNGELTNYLLKDQRTNMTTVYDTKTSPDAKFSTLEYEAIAQGIYENRNVSLLKIKLGTGRSHQIRTQLAHISHPLLGDARYGSGFYKGDVCLQAYLLGFNHPITGEYVQYCAKMPTDGPWKIFSEVEL